MRRTAFVLAMLFAGCAGATHSPSTANAPSPAPLPTGAVGELASYGRNLLVNSRALLKPYIVANVDCGSCHVAAGTKARGGTLVGIAAQFPQWNKRAHRVIALEDRIAECFLYSMNGHPPAYHSREMLALVTYITEISRGTPIGSGRNPQTSLAQFRPPHAPNRAHGSHIYTQKCSACHGANGAGNAVYPAVWGNLSFNSGAGMNRLTTMASFVRYNMPQNAPGSLSDQDSYDVAAYVLSHERPKFKKSSVVTFPSERASYF